MLMGQRLCRLALAWILGPAQRPTVPASEPPYPGQKQHPHKQALDLRQKSPPKRRYRIVIGMIALRGDGRRNAQSPTSHAPACGLGNTPVDAIQPEAPAKPPGETEAEPDPR